MGVFERAEGLEQLRALENNIPIQLAFVSYEGRTPCSVDNPEDADRAAAIIRAEGELVAA